jgi:hypothetical protein
MILSHAFRQCGLKATSNLRDAHVVQLTVDKRSVIVAVKGITEDERIEKKWGQYIVQAMLRVDLKVCERIGLVVGRELDMWIAAQEQALDALVKHLEGYPPPFPGKRLTCQQVAPSDPWVRHIVTSGEGRWRDSKWLVEK